MCDVAHQAVFRHGEDGQLSEFVKEYEAKPFKDRVRGSDRDHAQEAKEARRLVGIVGIVSIVGMVNSWYGQS